MIPKSWNDITVEQFIELKELGRTPADSITGRYLDTVLTLTDIDPEELEEYSLSQLTNVINKIAFIKKEPIKNYAKTIGDYTIMPYNKITWGMFIDLEYYYQLDYITNLPTICGILYRKQKENEWGVTTIEPYEYNPVERGKSFINLPVTALYGVATSYLEFRNDIVRNKYSALFNPDGVDQIDEELTPEEKAQEAKEIQKEKTFERWAYESITYDLAEKDITKMGDVLNLPLIYVLNILSMRKSLAGLG